jgi:hypothetical protein
MNTTPGLAEQSVERLFKSGSAVSVPEERKYGVRVENEQRL